MKKKINKPMRAAGALLVATMLTTCMTAGTFAKYTTTDSATDSARVAKFGVVVSANGALYGTQYSNNATNPTNEVVAYDPTDAPGTNPTASVKAYAVGSKNVVAPGTKNDTGLGFGVSGVPEVDTKVYGTISAKSIRLSAGKYGVLKPIEVKSADQLKTLSDTGNLYYHATSGLDKATEYTNAKYNDSTQDVYLSWETVKNYKFYILADQCNISDNDYYPIIYTLTGTGTDGTNASNSNTYSYTTDSLVTIAKAMAANLGYTASSIATGDNGLAFSATKNYEDANVHHANNALDTELKLNKETITWEWAFEREKATGTNTVIADATQKAENIAKYDAADTILGNLMAQDTAEETNLNGTGANADTTFIDKGMVVKLTETANAPTKVKAPVADTYTYDDSTNMYTATAKNDYNLKTLFYFDVSVTQVD